MKMLKSAISVLLVFSVLLLSACGGGGGAPAPAPAANVPPRAVISAPNSANQRTSAEISGTGSSDSDGSIAAYQWSLDNPDNINVSIENPTQVNTKLVFGEVQTTADITLNLKVTDNSDATASAQTKIRIVEIDAARLPPKPDVQISMQTVQGIDTDRNGVRDDMEHSLYGLYPLDTPRRETLLIGAHAVQMQVLAGSENNQSASDAASERSAEFAACAIAGNIDIVTLQQDIAALKLFALNTDARRRAYLAYKASRAGTVQRAINPDSANCSI